MTACIRRCALLLVGRKEISRTRSQRARSGLPRSAEQYFSPLGCWFQMYLSSLAFHFLQFFLRGLRMVWLAGFIWRCDSLPLRPPPTGTRTWTQAWGVRRGLPALQGLCRPQMGCCVVGCRFHLRLTRFCFHVLPNFIAEHAITPEEWREAFFPATAGISPCCVCSLGLRGPCTTI